jgi:hypothetical protein
MGDANLKLPASPGSGDRGGSRVSELALAIQVLELRVQTIRSEGAGFALHVLFAVSFSPRYPSVRQNPMPAFGTILELPVSGRWAKTAYRYFAKIAGF